MSKALIVAPLTILLTVFALFSCATPPEPIVEEPVVEVIQEKPQPAETPPPVEEKVTEAPAEEPEPEPEAEPEPAEEVFTVTEEFFTETFEDIRALITELNAIIIDENYNKWLTYLTQEYISFHSSDEILKKNSDQPLLVKYDITLRNLKDYFRYVVVPSRSNARLDDLVFIDNDHVKAIMIFKEQRTILYLLNRVDEKWKIGP